ncbi:MAG: HAD hydrolase-like protein [bacterium]|nr:HAD hydrolase-like protein [bacterium]MDA1024773.1 HAD hydrolase-like protein [bacterium]
MKNILLFDFDGVIANSFSLALYAFQQLVPGATAEMYRELYSGNINQMVKERNLGITSKQFTDVYNPLVLKELQPFDGMVELVDELRNDFSMVIITSSDSHTVKDFLKKNAISHAFLDVMGTDVDPSKERKIDLASKWFEFHPKESLFITDTLGDMHEAEKKSVPSIGVTWGFQARETLIHGSAKALVDTPEELHVEINKHFVK